VSGGRTHITRTYDADFLSHKIPRMNYSFL
jgi:hypothetical protein